MKCEGPITNVHQEEESAVEQGHAVESADDQELDSGEQHAPSYNCRLSKGRQWRTTCSAT